MAMTTNETMADFEHRFCVAPMMARTDRHCRYLMRLLSKRSLLYTEMITCKALIHGDRERLLRFDPIEQPLALQLGSNIPKELEICANFAKDVGYQEINLNIGCPSARTLSGGIGVSMMKDAKNSAECVRGISNAGALVSVKSRIGVDEYDSYEFLLDFAGRIWEAGCSILIVHARKAWLKGLNPKQNRHLPPLDYERVYQLKRDLPQLKIIINGGINSIDECLVHLNYVDGVMLGRSAYARPLMLNAVDKQLYGDNNDAIDWQQLWSQLLAYAQRPENHNLHQLLRHTFGLFKARAHSGAARRTLSRVRTLEELGNFIEQHINNDNNGMADSNRSDLGSLKAVSL